MSNNDKQDSAIEPEREVIEAEPAEVEAEQPAAAEGAVEEPPAASEAASHAPPARRGGLASLVVAVIALLLAIGVAGLGHYRAQQLEQRVAALSPAIERNAGRIANAEQRRTELRAAIDAAQAALERRVGGLQEAIDALRVQIGRDQSGWVLAETEYLMLIANHRLQLERDVSTAVAALQIADARLRDTGDPGLIGVREQLAAEITALNMVARPDYTGLALRLQGLAGQVERLPMKGTYQPTLPASAPGEAPAAESAGWRRLVAGIWSDLKGLVTVRRNEEAVRPMLAPEQQYFLRENLRLQLDAARLALLRVDPEQLRAALQTASEWLEKYFDERADVTQGMRKEIAAVEAVEIRPALPDISGSLNALRAHMRQAARQE